MSLRFSGFVSVALCLSVQVHAAAPAVPWAKFDRGMRAIYSNFLSVSSEPVTKGTYIDSNIERCFRPRRLPRCELAPYFWYSKLPNTFDKRITVLGVDTLNKDHEVIVRIALEDLSSLLQDPTLTKVIYGEEMKLSD